MFNRQVVQHNHLALVHTQGKLERILSVGSHYLLGRHEVDVHSRAEFPANLIGVDRLIVEYKDLLSPFLEVVQTSAAEIALVQKGTQYFLVKPSQSCAFWKDIQPVTVLQIPLPDDLLLPADWLGKFELTPPPGPARTFTVAAGQLGWLKRDGQLLTLLAPGKYGYFDIFPNTVLELVALNRAITKPDLIEAFKAHTNNNASDAAAQALRLERVAPDEVVVLKDAAGPVDICLSGNEYLVSNTLESVRISLTQLPCALPDWLQNSLRASGDSTSRSATFAGLLNKASATVEVPAEHLGILYLDGVVTTELQAGYHSYFTGGRSLTCKAVDQRLTLLEVVGQEILTQDKVPLRVNVTVSYQVHDVLKMVATLNKHEEFIYKEVQFALRAAIGSKTLDALLENKNVLDQQLHDYAAPTLAQHGIRLQSAGLKDLILPGEIKAILGKVVEAEKSAQANVIRRREETAATRSLLNTAKVMEDSPIALRMKELETLERITEKIDKISVFGGLEGVLKGLVKLTP